MKNETYIAILRGINVSGQKMIKMPLLKKMFEDLVFSDVQTYIQSGNVIFHHAKTDDQDLGKLIHEGILKTFGFEVPVIVLSKAEMGKVLIENPFAKHPEKDVGKLHVTFLSQSPAQDVIVNIEAGKYLPDEFIVKEKSIYLFCPTGYGQTKLHNNFFESKFKATATTRNWKTVNELVRLAEEMS
ncbi:DUF1697 domain-containing protein [Dyadobacter bucti]|uniref:DUF1697 domain-containing protein n=1 Tax=Dyadobacter bucti TaxID=2572203 RepID=UPI003F703F8D